MKTLTTFLKALAAATLIWFAAYLGTMGMLTTAFALSFVLLVVSVVVFIGGVWLSLRLLKRESDKWVRMLLLVLSWGGAGVLWVALARFNLLHGS